MMHDNVICEQCIVHNLLKMYLKKQLLEDVTCYNSCPDITAVSQLPSGAI